jgi:hypothetical protein
MVVRDVTQLDTCFSLFRLSLMRRRQLGVVITKVMNVQWGLSEVSPKKYKAQTYITIQLFIWLIFICCA